MFELDDCGKTVDISVRKGHYVVEQSDRAKAIMVIKAPRGTMVLFESKVPRRNRLVVEWNIQCEAIKAFMTQHKED